ncbi:hypothetical protein AB0K14_30660, partial [Actinosynnema sp. NPDC050801]
HRSRGRLLPSTPANPGWSSQLIESPPNPGRFTGELQPGAAFIAGALVALQPMAFDDLFKVVPQPNDTLT